MFDILCFSSSDWYGKWGSRQQVMMRLAASGNRVLFIEQMAGLEHFWKYPDLRKRRWQHLGEGLREIQPNLWLLTPPPLLPGRYYLAKIANLNAAIVQVWLKPYIRILQFESPILWLYKPEHTALIGRFNERLTVYHCIDEFTVGTQGRKRHIIESLEKNLLKQANLVFANSYLTYENKRRLNLNTYRLPSGVDADHFAQASGNSADLQQHPETINIPRPRLAFVGNINEKIDIALLVKVARTRPDWSLVMIGQTHSYTVNLEPLQKLSNVYWMGQQPFTDLPALLRGADVCLLPYIQGEATRYRSPLKLYEYLATGKPVVSTPHPEVNEFKDLIKIASGDAFLQAIEEALASNVTEDQMKRMQAAKMNSWDARSQEIIQVLQANLTPVT